MFIGSSNSTGRRAASLLCSIVARPPRPATPACNFAHISAANRRSPSAAPRLILTSNLHTTPARLNGARPPSSQKIQVNPFTLQNGDIPYDVVQVVNEETNEMSDPVRLDDVLNSYDHSTHVLKLMSEDPPVVKIVHIIEDRRRLREQQARMRLSKRLAAEDKELQVGWHVAHSDLQHKLQTARSIIEKGDKVHIVFANRMSGGKRNKQVPDEIKAQIIAMFEQGMSDTASRWQDDERTQGMWVMHWQPLSSITAEVRSKVVDSIVGDKRKKEDKKEARRLKEEERARKAKERRAEEAAKAAEILSKF